MSWRGWVAAAAWAAVAAPAAAADTPSFAEVRAAWRSSDTVVLDRHGEPLQRVRTDPTRRRADWVPLHEVSPALRHALLLSEDRRFHEHAGVDWTAVGAAAWANLWNTRTRGASTLTMQLAGLLDESVATPAGGRSLGAKLGQARIALALERHWTKAQILEAYLNLVAFRGELVGVGALSQALFHKLPSGLDAEESAIAAALVRAPNAAPAAVARRACGVLQAQGRGAACETLEPWTRQVLASRGSDAVDRDAQLAPHVARRLVAGAPPATATVRSTLDRELQRHARDTLRQHLAELRDRQVEDGAVIVIDNASGEVLAWVGSSGELSQAAQVDGVNAPRQAGSTLKPFLYAQAIEERRLTAASILDDSPVGIATPAGLYLPQNYDRRFVGPVSLRTALGSSLNVPAVRTLGLVSPERFAQRLQGLGIALKRHGDFYGHSLALGAPEVTLAQLANAYRALANGGTVTPLRLRPTDPAPPPRRALDAAASFVVADILADREARVATFGLDNALAPRYWAAVKTGTSKDMRDNWCIGFSRRHTVGVWVGNASGAPMHDVSGITGAAPVWRAVMDRLERGAALPPPALPDGVRRQAVRFEPAIEPPREELFVAGTEQPVVVAASTRGRSGSLIAAPIDRSVIALDPDIPPQAQRLQLAAVDGVPTGWSWRMDGRRLGPATPTTWPLWPGEHRLELVDAGGRTVSQVRFEVRGAGVRPAGPAR